MRNSILLFVLILVALVFQSAHAFIFGPDQLSYNLDFGNVFSVRVITSCPRGDQTKINASTIIESFFVDGANREEIEEKFGYQEIQSYPLYVKGNQLRMRVKFIDAIYPEAERIIRMDEHGSVLLGIFDSTDLPSCSDGQWYRTVDVRAISNLKVVHKIKFNKKDESWNHKMVFSDGNKTASPAGWRTRNGTFKPNPKTLKCYLCSAHY